MVVEGEINILFYSILFYSILFYSILFYSILFYSILFYSILFKSVLFGRGADGFHNFWLLLREENQTMNSPYKV